MTHDKISKRVTNCNVHTTCKHEVMHYNNKNSTKDADASKKFMLQYSAIKRLSRIEYFTTAVVNNLLYYLDTQPILT